MELPRTDFEKLAQALGTVVYQRFAADQAASLMSVSEQGILMNITTLDRPDNTSTSVVIGPAPSGNSGLAFKASYREVGDPQKAATYVNGLMAIGFKPAMPCAVTHFCIAMMELIRNQMVASAHALEQLEVVAAEMQQTGFTVPSFINSTRQVLAAKFNLSHVQPNQPASNEFQKHIDALFGHQN